MLSSTDVLLKERNIDPDIARKIANDFLNASYSDDGDSGGGASDDSDGDSGEADNDPPDETDEGDPEGTSDISAAVSLEELEQMTKNELMDAAEKAGLATSGKKGMILGRLTAFFELD